MYIIQEIQTSNGQTALTPAITKTDKNEADSVYHSILASAAISSVEIHAVTMVNEHGGLVKSDYYEHRTEASGE